jgi:hypothetical protein
VSEPRYLFHRVKEHNEWEDETWYHYFLDAPGVAEAIYLARQKEHCDLSHTEKVELYSAQMEVLANQDDMSYMATHWFGKLVDFSGLANATEQDLYKGGIRHYGEDLLEEIEIEEES